MSESDCLYVPGEQAVHELAPEESPVLVADPAKHDAQVVVEVE